ncbi:class I SAM-dependent methyltransferase [Arthrobacter terrae]|uniref:class I SAM-dependent methyltransferase n=1 Tax=Arthrobacter terrae TaxID=2935737 RepID=UPI0028AEBE58|nr:class I SAM-dependent methyltransferase [Arthrobacter terrae]
MSLPGGCTEPVEPAVPAAESATIHWTEAGIEQQARWHSQSRQAAPVRIVVGDDRLSADRAYRLVQQGTGILWRGDFQNARQLLSALARRVGRQRQPPRSSAAATFRQHRESRTRQAQLLGLLLVPLASDYSVPLRRAPDVAVACTEAYGVAAGPSVIALRELTGVIGAHEWRHKGVQIPALGARIYPHYGVFSPIRGEYLALVSEAPLPQAVCASGAVAFDVGTGTGVLAAILGHRGVQRVIATDQDRRAVDCARENLSNLNLAGRVEVVETDLFPAGRAALVVCNPPWIPAMPASTLDHAVYDPESNMLRRFLAGLKDHLEPEGEGWLVLSDLAEHLELRSRGELLAMIDESGLVVVDRSGTAPTHRRAGDTGDLLHAARSAEITSLWRLKVR